MFIIGSKFSRIMEILKLDKPLVIFDIETTGPNISIDKIVEIAYIKIWENGKMKRDDIYINPEVTIGKEVSAIHGLDNENLKDRPTFQQKSQELFDVFSNCFYGGFNIINFDLPVLRREFVRVGMDLEYSPSQIIDAKEIFKFLEPKNLSAAYSHYCHKEIKQKPGAMGDSEIAADVLLAQMEKYQDLMNVDFIKRIYHPNYGTFKDNSQKFYWRKGETYLSFSKYKDRPLSEVAKEDPSFLEWMLTAEFSNEAKDIIRMILNNSKNNKKTIVM
ncbi:MAG: hypothetical protein BWY51_00683 [Parcubacteria group bacterium ADurb.Bin316]|nr:MAG: hypothetical protein BWY51_00683 [Parcubacteria group bacterium ADurb.Bin316]